MESFQIRISKLQLQKISLSAMNEHSKCPFFFLGKTVNKSIFCFMQILVLVRFVLVLASEHEFDNYINVNAGSSFWYLSGILSVSSSRMQMKLLQRTTII